MTDKTNEFKKQSGYECRAKFLNSTFETRIVKTLAVFTYNEDTNDTSNEPRSGEPGNVDIGPGEAGYRYSRNEEDCVTTVYVFIVTDNAGSFDQATSAPAGYCLIEPVFELAPAFARKRGEAKSKPGLVLRIKNAEPDGTASSGG